jgi:putative ABC transport system permease protein
MKNFMGLVSKHLLMHRKKTWLAILSVAISVALVTGVFSMLDVFLRFEKIQVIHEYGNYHLAVIDASDKEISSIKSRIDVMNSGRWKDLGDGAINGISCRLGAVDEAFAGNMNIKVLAGKYPTNKDEIMLEQWAMESLYLNADIGCSFEGNRFSFFLLLAG